MVTALTWYCHGCESYFETNTIDRMKKYLFILGMAGISLFTSCSTAEDAETGPTAEDINRMIIEAGMDSDVPIRLSMASPQNIGIVTRAPLESESDKTFVTTTPNCLGVFLLAQKTQVDPNTTIGPVASSQIKWDNTTTYARILWNIPAKAIKSTEWYDEAVSEGFTDIQFLASAPASPSTPYGDAQVHYYPYGNWYNYYFYTYYPYQSTGVSCSEDGKTVKVSYTLDGSQDIISGIAVPPAAKLNNGFNAKYFRALKKANEEAHSNNSDYYKVPFADRANLQLNHKLTQLRFWVKTDRAYATEGDRLRVKSIALKDVPVNWDLIVANKVADANGDVSTELLNNSTTGSLTLRTTGVADIPLRAMTVDTSDDTDVDNYMRTVTASSDVVKVDGQEANYIPLTNDYQLAGYAMVPTTAMLTGAQLDQLLHFEMTADWTHNSVTQNLTISPQLVNLPNDGNSTFEAGKAYNIILTLPIPEEARVSAELDQWTTVAPGSSNAQDSEQNVDYNID